MFFVVPYQTDAAVSHRPWATGALIAANLAIGATAGFVGDGAAINAWGIQGGRFAPWTWITAAFLHMDWVHLVGNMVFLWPFGLVVEGYAGPVRFLGAYLAISFAGSGAMQLMLIGREGVTAAGASLAISGVMAMAALWAPRNRISVWFWFLTIIRRIQPTVWGFCLFWIGLDLLGQLFSGLFVTSATAHLLGAAGGAFLAWHFVEEDHVDCEGWDWFSLRKHGRPKGARVASVIEPAAASAEDGAVAFHDALDRGDAGGADRLLRTVPALRGGDAVPRRDHLRLVELLDASPAHPETVIERMRDFVRRFPDGAGDVRLALARRLVDAGRPRQALDELDALRDDDDALTARQRAKAVDLAAKARSAQPPPSGLELE